MGILDLLKRTNPNYMPEVEQTEAVPDEVYVVAGSIQEFKAYKRSRRQYPDARYVEQGIFPLRGVRNALVIFTGSWSERPDGVDLWEYANAGGNKVIEDFVL